MANKTFFGEIVRGMFRDNPTFGLVLGLCAPLAITTCVKNGVGMALATSFVLICSNLIISSLARFFPGGVRLPCFIVVVATFTTIVELVMAAYTPALHKELGIFIPLIVVNCIILGRAEAYASRNSPIMSIADGIGEGIGFLFALVLISSIRELLGAGSLWGYQLAKWTDITAIKPASIMILPPGAFLLIGLLMGFFAWLKIRKAEKKTMRSYGLQMQISKEIASEEAAKAAEKAEKTDEKPDEKKE